MKVKFNVDMFGYTVGGHNNYFDTEFSELELKGKSEEEIINYVEKIIYEYICENIEFGCEIEGIDF